MITMPFPPPDFRIQKRGEKQVIFDSIRKRWVALTEEEWVRQNVVAYLVKGLSYPKEAIAIEKEIEVNGLKRRFDILVYNRHHQPWMMIECKAPGVDLSENVLQQVLRYNTALPVNWIVISNGKATIGWQKVEKALKMVAALPVWKE